MLNQGTLLVTAQFQNHLNLNRLISENESSYNKIIQDGPERGNAIIEKNVEPPNLLADSFKFR